MKMINIFPYIELLVKSLQQRYVNLEVFVVVANVDECTKELMGEYELEGLSVFLD
jgi:hypothetical protein